MTITSSSDAVFLDDIEVESVSWGAIIAGAIGAFALTLALAALGTGLGLSAVSPWGAAGGSVSMTTFAVTSAVWLVIMQWLSSAIGGYLAGRLRNRSTSTHRHEAFFRDTAHGFLAWAVATLIVAVLAGSSIASLISGGASAVSSAAGSITSSASTIAAGRAAQPSSGASSGLPTDYFVDMLFRPGQNGSAPATTPGAPAGGDNFADVRSEASQIITRGVTTGDWSAPDKAELSHLIAVHTGMSDADAQHRVDDVLAQIAAAKLKLQQAADAARKAGLAFAMMTALSLAIGAFIASVSGAIGGRLRDAA